MNIGFIRTTNNPNRRFTIDEMWINTGFDNIRRLLVEKFYTDLKKFYREDRIFFKVIIGDLNAKIGQRRRSEERHIGTHELEWNEQGERQSEFIMATKTIRGNSQFQKHNPQRWTWESHYGEYHNEIDRNIVNRFCLTDVAAVLKF
ncbi:unnamed protein product [Angiostrongylus costaricensis]|uniref:Craniofacial development protein 2-like n=1 Tax=Angiostrongylus costaricensis TaxID=334426 RepID=A0A0R3Q2P7_ANGCS|nr:unnamed protein product [Angiostrongylus costaricensis]